jgi:Serine dehydrogenase proteinase
MAQSHAKTTETNGRAHNGRAAKAALKAAASGPNKPANASPAIPEKPVVYTGSMAPRAPLPEAFGSAIRDLESALELPVWMLVQTGATRPIGLFQPVMQKFLDAREELAECGHVALVIDSPGGLAQVAYKIARILQRNGGFTVVIPRYAKSAATLLALGAVRALMGEDAEIGPLDVQLWDEERDEEASALNEVQALDQLNSVALQHLDQTMMTMVAGTKKKTDVLLPIAAKFVSDMMCPMLNKIDAVHYAKQARILAVAEHYAERLLAIAGNPPPEGHRIADALVNRYPEHGFIIDRQEVEESHFLPIIEATSPLNEPVRALERVLHTHQITALGRLQEA